MFFVAVVLFVSSFAHAQQAEPADRVSCVALNKTTGQSTQVQATPPAADNAEEFGNSFSFKEGNVEFKATVDRWVAKGPNSPDHVVDPYIPMQATEIFPDGHHGPEVLDQSYSLKDMAPSVSVGIMNYRSEEGVAYDFTCKFE